MCKCHICNIELDKTAEFWFDYKEKVCRCCYCKLSAISNENYSDEQCKGCLFEHYNKNDFLHLYDRIGKFDLNYAKNIEDLKGKELFVCPQRYQYAAMPDTAKFVAVETYKNGIILVEFSRKQTCEGCGYKKRLFYKIFTMFSQEEKVKVDKTEN